MRPIRRPAISFKIRILPGRIIRIRPHRLRQLRWKCGDSLVWIPQVSQALIFRKPTEREWRIERCQLRGRRVPVIQWPPRCPRTLAGWKRLGRERYTREDLLPVIGHITPIGGNVFLDLGFPPDEAERLKEESDRRISRKKHELRSEEFEQEGVFVSRGPDLDVTGDGATKATDVTALKGIVELRRSDSTNSSYETTPEP